MNLTTAIAQARTWLDKVLRWQAFRAAKDSAERIWDATRSKLDLSLEMASTNRRTRLARNILATGLSPPVRYLEIGSFEGGSLAFVHALLDGKVRATVIDPFEYDDELTTTSISAVEARFRANSSVIGADVRILKGQSSARLPELIAAKESFDLIYIDGWHAALDMIVDASLCWRLLAPHGLMIFDDYHGFRDCRLAINMFIKMISREVVIVDLAGQAFLRRRS